MKTFNNQIPQHQRIYVSGKVAWSNLKKGIWKSIAHDEWSDMVGEIVPIVFSVKSSLDWKVTGWFYTRSSKKLWYEFDYRKYDENRNVKNYKYY